MDAEDHFLVLDSLINTEEQEKKKKKKCLKTMNNRIEIRGRCLGPIDLVVEFQ